MAWFETHLLTLILFFPFIWALLGLVLPSKSTKTSRSHAIWAFLGSLIAFGFSLTLLPRFETAATAFQLTESVTWIPSLGVTYSLGIDGLSLWLILLTTFMTPLVILASFSAVTDRKKEYYFLLLALETGMIGAFVTLDAFLFYVFWEAMLIPMVLLIGIWGGKERLYAANKFFLFTVAGSLLMLVAIFYLGIQHSAQFGMPSLLLTDLMRVQIPGGGWFSAQSLLFLAFALAFAIKVPLFPLHTWLPDAHVQAPTAGSVILAGVLLKMGGYGFVRFAFPLFPEAVRQYQFVFMGLGSIAIVYGAWMALVQEDVKKLVAYSSVSHMGYVILGLFSLTQAGMMGGMYQMLNHGVTTGALFLLVGMIYERRHTRNLSEFGGIARVMPLFATILLIVTFSAVALPGTNGFVGEFLILLGAWHTHPLFTAIGTTGVVFGAVYMLLMARKMLFGKLENEENKVLQDLGFRELAVLAPLVVAIVAMGVLPNPFFKKMDTSIAQLITRTASPTTVSLREAK